MFIILTDCMLTLNCTYHIVLGHGEIVIQSSDKVSDSHSPPCITMPKEIKKSFEKYRDYLLVQSTSLGIVPKCVQFFSKSYTLVKYAHNSMSSKVDTILSKLFSHKVTNNTYRHYVATAMLANNVPRSITKTLMRTSERQLKSVYEQITGSSELLQQHKAVIRHCTQQPMLAGTSSGPTFEILD